MWKQEANFKGYYFNNKYLIYIFIKKTNLFPNPSSMKIFLPSSQ